MSVGNRCELLLVEWGMPCASFSILGMGQRRAKEQLVFIELLTKLLKVYADKRVIHVILDNHAIQLQPPDADVARRGEVTMSSRSSNSNSMLLFVCALVSGATHASGATTHYYRFETQNGAPVFNGQTMTKVDE